MWKASSLVLCAACGGGHPPAAPKLGKALAAALTAADRETAPWRCTAADTPALVDERVGDWHVAGHVLHRVPSDAEIRIGVVGDTGGSAPATLAALGRLRAQLDAAKPELVVTLGGMGTTEAELEATLGTLADHASWPIVALPGDLEAESAHTAAIAALRKKGALVLDARLARWIELPGATIATIPGSQHLVAGEDGCASRAADATKLYADLANRPGLRIAALADAPRTVRDGEPTGELALVPAPAQVDVILATAPLSPATSGGRDGAHTTLSPGTADATTRLPRVAHPSAGLLEIHGATWSWKPLLDRP